MGSPLDTPLGSFPMFLQIGAIWGFCKIFEVNFRLCGHRGGGMVSFESPSPPPSSNDGPGYPENTKHLYNIYTMLDQRRRRWTDVVQMFYKYFLFVW